MTEQPFQGVSPPRPSWRRRSCLPPWGSETLPRQRSGLRSGRRLRSTRYLTEQEQAEVRKANLLRGFGEADYAFTIPKAGWYELWVAACDWSTDLLLDGRLLTHTSFVGEDWKPQGGAQKVLNLPLSAGEHVLSFHRSWPFGLPYMTRFFLQPAQDAAGMVRLTPKKDYLVFRRGETFSLLLQAGAPGRGLRHSPCDGRSGNQANRVARNRESSGR